MSKSCLHHILKGFCVVIEFLMRVLGLIFIKIKNLQSMIAGFLFLLL